jgi:hypothetical protein
MAGKFIVELTRAQHMALLNVITQATRCTCANRVDEYVDCASTRHTVTTPGELLRLVSEAKVVSKSRNA